MSFYYTCNISNTNFNVSTDLRNNPAYEFPTQLHKNLAYEDSDPRSGELKRSSPPLHIPEPTYELIPPANSQTASATMEMAKRDEVGDKNTTN